MPHVDLIIFDLDGTLVDSRRDLANSVNYALKDLDLPPLEMEVVMSYVGDGLKKLINRSLSKNQLQKIDEVIAIFRSHYREHLLDFSTFYPNVENILCHFQAKKMAVVSNKPYEFTRLILERLNADNFFEIILGGDSLPEMKPDPGPILHILSQLSVSPDKAAIVGDGTTDIEAGKATGIKSIAVTTGLRSRDFLETLKPYTIIDNLQEMEQLVQ
ncbi:HAD-IA family hydrolase [candidate division KSB1 bacterium]|nr:HAD-IA family hydrolase [candidate division KSB1 bacterium]